MTNAVKLVPPPLTTPVVAGSTAGLATVASKNKPVPSPTILDFGYNYITLDNSFNDYKETILTGVWFELQTLRL